MLMTRRRNVHVAAVQGGAVDVVLAAHSMMPSLSRGFDVLRWSCPLTGRSLLAPKAKLPENVRFGSIPSRDQSWICAVSRSRNANSRKRLQKLSCEFA